MTKACALAVLAAVFVGCAARSSSWKGRVEWPDAASTPQVIPAVEAGATLAAAAAIREMIRENPFPNLFQGCSSPEQGLDAAVFKDPKSGLYYVVLHQHFSRCGGPRGRVLDWWYEYAVTSQGEVVGRAPPDSAEAPAASPPASPSSPPGQPPPEQTSPPLPIPIPVPVPALPLPTEPSPSGTSAPGAGVPSHARGGTGAPPNSERCRGACWMVACM
jgi:hypothetical protein